MESERNMLLQIARSLVALLLVFCAVSGSALAQDTAVASARLAAEQKQTLDALAVALDGLEKDIATHGDDDAFLVRVRLKLEAASAEALQSALEFKPRQGEINTRLEQLGPPPADGQPPEAETVTQERTALLAEKTEINGVIANAQNLSLRSNKLIEQIAVIRRDLFRNMLTRHYTLNETLSAKVLSDAGAELSRFNGALSSWAFFAFKHKFNAMVAATLLAMIAAVVLLFGGRRLVGGLYRADPAVEKPPYLTRLSVAFWSTLLPTLALAVFLAATYFFFSSYQVLRGDIDAYLRAAMQMVVGIFLVNRLVSAVLAPKLPQWRLVHVESRAARWLVRLGTAMAVAVGLNNFLSRVADQMASPLSLTIARSFVAALVVGIILVFIGRVKPFRTEEGQWKPWPAWLRYGLFALGGLTIAAALLGYVGFSIFLSLQVVMTGTILVTAYIGFLCANAIGAEGGLDGSWLGRRLVARGYAGENTLDQIGLGLSILLNILILLLVLPLTLFMWGFQPGDIQAWARKLATGFNVGSATISLVGILSGLFVFAMGYLLTRWFQGWLDGSVMARGKVDAGVRNSIRLAIGYSGIAIAALMAISAAGINLSSLALVAGALSLGIGFGLQNVVSNFVSGLILLAERPFKVGDWIVAGDVSGTVRKISVRATEIETFQRQSVILPNSNLINNAVGNWTHRNKLGRVEVKVGVVYGSDARRVQEILYEIARAHPAILKNPEPFVLFTNFGTAALEFELRFFLADITNSGGVQNDIRFAILDAFGREGIEIPSSPRAEHKPPKLEPWPSDDDKSEVEAAERERLKAEAGKAAKGRRRAGKPDPA